VFNRERRLSHFIPWRTPIKDGITLLADAGLVAVYEIDSPAAWETAQPDDLAYLHNRLNMTWRSVARDELILTTLQCRGEANPDDYLTGEFRTAFAATLDQRYRDGLYDHSLYSNRTLLCVQVRPARPVGDWVGERMDKRRAARQADAPVDRVRRLEVAMALIEANLSRYSPRLLKVTQRGRQLFSEPAEAIAYAITGVWRPVCVTTGFMGRAMLSERIIFGRETIEIRGLGSSQFAAMLGMSNYPASFWPGMFGHLHGTPYRHTVMHSFRCMSSTEGHAVLTRKQNKMLHAGDKALSQAAELDTAADELSSARFVMGDHCFTMCVFADSVKALGEVVTTAWRDLADAGLLVAREGVGNQAAYLSMIPGNHALRLRPGAISSRAFAAFSPLHGYPTGERDGYWGEPIALFRTMGGTPYRFHLHVGDLGNTFVTGRSGSGKTTWLGFLLAQAERADVRSIVWDKDRGLELAVRALGGSYLALRNGKPSVAPLKALDGSKANDLTFLRQLLRGCIQGDSGYEITEEEDRRLALGLRAVMALPPADRWLEDVRAFLPHSIVNGAGARLEAWCWGREKGWIIDGPRHQVDLSAPVIGFDQTDILDNAEARGPVMATLYYLCESLIDGRRLLFIVDEFWKSLLDPAFRDLVHDRLKTLRKRGAAMVLATQSPRDALDSVIAHTIREQCPTGVHFANPNATDADYGDKGGVGLSPVEVETVRGLEQGDGTFLLRQGQRSLVAQLPLHGMAAQIAVLSGRESTVRLLDQVRADVGDDPADWLPEFERRRVAPRVVEKA